LISTQKVRKFPLESPRRVEPEVWCHISGPAMTEPRLLPLKTTPTVV
jgi:hypothetical protein